MSFSDWMLFSLYDPVYGYYSRKHFSLDKQGDFITAPTLSPLFAMTWVRIASPFWEMGYESLLEIGAGTGQFAHDFLLAAEKQKRLPEHYIILEKSHRLIEKQRYFLREALLPHLYARIEWISDFPAGFTGIVIANEVLDALPVDLFTITKEGPKERFVKCEDDAFHWEEGRPHSDRLNKEIQRITDTYSLAVGYQAETHLALQDFVDTCTNRLHAGVIFFIDYGYGEEEYYHPLRTQGTLTCFKAHQQHDNPLLYPGEQDITAHVNFTLVAESALQNNCEVIGYTSQSAFLLASGIMDELKDAEVGKDDLATYALRESLKILTMPTEMGEYVKVMALGKVNSLYTHLPHLYGFDLQDRKRDL